jgi:hypothetical protein
LIVPGFSIDEFTVHDIGEKPWEKMGIYLTTYKKAQLTLSFCVSRIYFLIDELWENYFYSG